MLLQKKLLWQDYSSSADATIKKFQNLFYDSKHFNLQQKFARKAENSIQASLKTFHNFRHFWALFITKN